MNAQTPANEFRRQGRQPFSGKVTYLDDGGSEFAALDLSHDGVGLLSPRPLAAGQTIQLAFLNGSIVVKGRVRHVQEVQREVWRVGVDFLGDEFELAEVALAVN